MDKYFKIQKLVELQKERKEKLEKIFLEVLEFLPKFEVEFASQERVNYKSMSKETLENPSISFLVKVKIKDKSSVKFVVSQHKEKILEEYSKIFAADILVLS